MRTFVLQSNERSVGLKQREKEKRGQRSLWGSLTRFLLRAIESVLVWMKTIQEKIIPFNKKSLAGCRVLPVYLSMTVISAQMMLFPKPETNRRKTQGRSHHHSLLFPSS
jgi:hypothetical protein